jgi:hypothetical protein
MTTATPGTDGTFLQFFGGWKLVNVPVRTHFPGPVSRSKLHSGDKVLIPNSYNVSRLVSEDSMESSISILVLILAALGTGCGSSGARMLESVTATPASADAQNFPNGTVQSTPTGIFNKAPTRVTPLRSVREV